MSVSFKPLKRRRTYAAAFEWWRGYCLSLDPASSVSLGKYILARFLCISCSAVVLSHSGSCACGTCNKPRWYASDTYTPYLQNRTLCLKFFLQMTVARTQANEGNPRSRERRLMSSYPHRWTKSLMTIQNSIHGRLNTTS